MHRNTFKTNLDNKGLPLMLDNPSLSLNNRISIICTSVFQFPKFYQNHIYYSTNQGEVVKWDITSQKEVWRNKDIILNKTNKSLISEFSLKIFDDLIYVNYENKTYRINKEGQLVDVLAQRMGPHTILIDNNLFVRTDFTDVDNVYVEVIDKINFNSKWQYKLNKGYTQFILQFAGSIIFSDGTSKIICCHAESGTILWAFDITKLGTVTDPLEQIKERRLEGFPFIANDTLIMGVSGGLVLGIDPVSGEEKFKTKLDNIFSPGNYSYALEGEIFTSNADSIVKEKVENGDIMQEFDLSFLVKEFGYDNHSNFTFAQDQIFFNYIKQPHSFVLDKNTGTLLKTFQLENYSFYPPYIHNDHLYILDYKGNLYQA